MRLITDAHLWPELAAWAAERIEHVGAAGFGPCCAVGVPHKGELAAVVVYHDWQPRAGTVQLSMASDHAGWINRGVIGRILGFAFERPWASGEVRKVWVSIPLPAGAQSTRVTMLNEALGLRKEGILRQHFGPGVHCWIGGIMAGEWRKRYQPQPQRAPQARELVHG